jgi:hypothetical protein
MEPKTLVENIATWMRDRDDRLAAWITVIGRSLGQSQLTSLRNDVEDELARIRARPSYEECLAQFQRELDDAKEVSTLIALLNSLGPADSNVGQ